MWKLMGREVHDRFIGIKDGTRSIAVVHVPIHDENLFPAFSLSMASGNGHVIEDAKAHSAVGHSVMSGRPDERKSAIVAVQNCIYGGDRASCCHQSCIVGISGQDRIQVKIATAFFADGLNLVYISASVNGCYLIHSGC